MSGQEGSFDLFRITKSKDVVDICANTLRDYHARGLPFYRAGKPIFVSKSELLEFIKSGGPTRPYVNRGKGSRSGAAKHA